MWSFRLRFAELAICRFGECGACAARDREPPTVMSSLPAFAALKRDAVAMHTARQIVHRHDPYALCVARASDDQVIARLERLLASGVLRICGGGGGGGEVVEDPARDERRVRDGVPDAVLALQASGDLAWRGRAYRIAAPAQCRPLRETGQYEIVPPAQARDVLAAMAADPRRPEPERVALKTALDLLADGGAAPAEGHVLLLRKVQVRLTKRGEHEVITPAAYGRALAQDPNVHWIEIEMVDEDGRAVAGQEYAIETADKHRFTGVTDGSGRVRLDNIVAGRCWVSFRNLDKGSWRPA